MITICENYAARPGALGLEVLRSTTDPEGNPIYKRISWQPSLAAALMAVKKDRELQTLSDDITLDEAIKRLLRIETDMLTAIQALNRSPAAAIAREAAREWQQPAVCLTENTPIYDYQKGEIWKRNEKSHERESKRSSSQSGHDAADYGRPSET